jgi:hypothetical protein
MKKRIGPDSGCPAAAARQHAGGSNPKGDTKTLRVLGVLVAATAALVATLVFAAPAFADNPHFVNASAAINNTGSLVVSWKEAGLGDNQQIDYEASADANGFYACINGGNKHPQAANKEAFEGPVSGSGTFSSGKNGQITASLTVAPPPTTLDCPNGQRLVLACVRYTNVSLTDTTNDIIADIPGTVSRTFFAIEECETF